jgi:hypothetical protein
MTSPLPSLRTGEGRRTAADVEGKTFINILKYRSFSLKEKEKEDETMFKNYIKVAIRNLASGADIPVAISNPVESLRSE